MSTGFRKYFVCLACCVHRGIFGGLSFEISLSVGILLFIVSRLSIAFTYGVLVLHAKNDA